MHELRMAACKTKAASVVVMILSLYMIIQEHIWAQITPYVTFSGTVELSNREILWEPKRPVALETVTFEALLKDYTKKLKDIQTSGLWRKNIVKPCDEEIHPGWACVESSCPRPQPTTPEDNLRSVLSTMSDLNHQHLSLMLGLFPEPPSGKRVMFVSAASKNHYHESQGLMRNLHQNVFPYISNYTFVYYDLGLLPEQRKKIEKHCRCEVRKFPQKYMPLRLQNLGCFAWKPFIIQANLPKTEILVWVDSCVRFWNKTVPHLLKDVERRGIVTFGSNYSVAQHTMKETVAYMKEDTCSLTPVPEDQGGFLLFHNEQWIREAVIKPWVACAMSSKCMCPRHSSHMKRCNVKVRKYNKCHRFDQSVINIILHKLFRGHGRSFYSPFNERPNVTFARGGNDDYFGELDRSSHIICKTLGISGC
ncbi:uncharacterized protein LOC124118471 [Haliotis rufescens]|uniref:uncharacterized protein LOC124118471 n=1 Tax=Haliotis rufescens TaxID=6454 RepID=UPI00201EFA0E|nr:uncharacterized protein LOC124118471 [Haliotis rufescens]XP_046336541.2 uncharacterized protein LOC124118471 [Haliotis rufescens]